MIGSIRCMRLLPIAFSVVLAASVFAQSGGEQMMPRKVTEVLTADAQSQVVACAGVVSSFREAAMLDPAGAVGYFMGTDAASKWKATLSADMSVQQLTDFFTGAAVLSGTAGKNGGVVGLYNPWWDAILFLNVVADTAANFDGAPFRVDDFAFFSGETFRGEIDETGVRCVTVVPEEDPLSVELWRVTVGTRKAFTAMFPVEKEAGRAWGRLAKMRLNMDKEREMERLQTRSVLRLQHSVALLKNAKDTGVASFLTRLARKGSLFRLYTYFREPNSRVLLKSFSELPEIARKGFTPYSYIPTEKATLYVLVNKDMPTLYVTVTLMKDIKAETSSFEWYYLTQADELLDAWNNRKEVAK